MNLLGLPEDAPERKAIRLINPINEDLSLMRTTLAPQMIHAIARNQKNGCLKGRVYDKLLRPPHRAQADDRRH